MNKEKELYHSPLSEVVNLHMEGVVCASQVNESVNMDYFDPFSNGEVNI